MVALEPALEASIRFALPWERASRPYGYLVNCCSSPTCQDCVNALVTAACGSLYFLILTFTLNPSAISKTSPSTLALIPSEVQSVSVLM